jgi:hypothetical protein
MTFAARQRDLKWEIQLYSVHLRDQEVVKEACLHELENPEISSEEADFVNDWLRRAQLEIDRLRNYIKSSNDKLGETAG